MLYGVLLALHNIVRWLVIAGMIWALAVVFRDYFGGGKWTTQHQRAGLAFSSLLNVQLILGIAVYVLGPFGTVAMEDFGGAMGDAVLRFFTLEHPLQMLLAVILAQVGYSVSKRTEPEKKKFRWAAICYGLAALLILIATPWPFFEAGRPLLPQLTVLFV